jgi:hypothetical protein
LANFHFFLRSALSSARWKACIAGLEEVEQALEKRRDREDNVEGKRNRHSRWSSKEAA